MIKLGYEIGTGKEVNVRPSHLIVTGVTQLSGKTTTLEALIKRSGLKAIVFKTKIGEKSFSEGTEIAPFFRDRSDYEFVKSLIEAYAKEKLFLEKGTLMQLCKGSASLIDIKKRVDEKLTGKLRGLQEEIYTRLQHYLENLIPQIQYANLSKTLTVYEGINIMNLERFSEEAQSLIIQSVADEVLKNMTGVIIVIPEAWKFIPQKYNNPCKRGVEAFIRQGAANNNFVWIDSQDMAGVDKTPLKQISTWILGYQSERNEVKHTLDQISLPAKLKPKEDEIMGLRKGHFFISSYDGVKKVYVQPAWLESTKAINVAMGESKVEDYVKPQSLVPFTVQHNKQEPTKVMFDDSKLRRDLVDLRQDFFNKIEELQNALNKAYEKLYTLENEKQDFDEEDIISKVLQKMPTRTVSTGTNFDKEALIREVLSKVPKTVGSVTYSVAPLEKIKKEFLQEAKDKVLADVGTLSNNAKRTLKYLESKGVGCSTSEIATKGFLYKDGGGGYAKIVNDSMRELSGVLVGEKVTNGACFGRLKRRIADLLSTHGATEAEVQQVYDHVINDLL